MTTTASDFLHAVYGDAPGYFSVFTAQDEKTRFFPNTDQGRRDAAAYAVKRAAEADVYFGLGLFEKPPSSGRGKAVAVAAIGGVWADVDFGPGHKNPVPVDEETARRLLNTINPAPSIIVRSGGGWHVYWLFKKPWMFKDAADQKRAAALSKAWQAKLRRVYEAEGYTLDSTHDLARVLRLPGTLHRKDPANIRPVEIFYPAGDLNGNLARYDATDLDVPLEEIPKQAQPASQPPVNYDFASAMQRCMAYLKCCPDAVSGKGGHKATLFAACTCYRFGLSDADARRVMDQFNATKTGGEKWTDREIEHKLIDAKQKVQEDGEFGCLLNAEKPADTRQRGTPQAASSGSADVQVDYPDPLPLDDPKAPPMPAGLLPSWLGRMAESVAEATETPLELPAMLGLSAVATAAQGKFSVRPEPGYFEPVNVWTAPAMKSGQRKTAVHKRMTKPLLDWESEQCEEAAAKIKKVESEIKTMEARVTKLRAKCAGEDDPTKRNQLQDEITQLEASIPPLPVLPRLFTQDVTPEHLGTMMADHDERMAVLSDEGGIFDILGGRYSSGIPNLDLFLQSHSGAPVRVDRGSRPPVVLNHPLLTMGLSPQPDVLRALNGKPGFRGRGLLARFLYSLPESKMGHRDLVPRDVSEYIADRYAAGVRALLETPLRYRDGKKPVPHVLTFDEQGYAAWKEHQRRVEIDLRETGRFAGITDWAGKLPGAVARLAALMHCAKYALEPTGPADRRIDCEIVQCAVRLGDLLAEHALIVFGLMADNSVLEDARKVWHHVKSTEATAFTFSAIWHPLRGSFKTSEDIEPAVEMLLDHYLILPVEDGTPGRVGRRGRRFVVNPKALEVSGE